MATDPDDTTDENSLSFGWCLSLLHVAAGSGDSHLMERVQRSLLHVAAGSGDSHLMERVLLHVQDVNVLSPKGEPALNLAIRGDHRECVKLLACDPGIKLCTGNALHVACELGRVKCLEMLLTLVPFDPATVNSVTALGVTALHMACELRCFEPVMGPDSCRRLKCMRLLVEAGASVNAACHEGRTPLHSLCHSFNPASHLNCCVKWLLDRPGLDVNPVDCRHQTPLDVAVMAGQGSLASRLLQMPDINPNGGAPLNRSPLYEACTQNMGGTIVALLKHDDTLINTVAPPEWEADGVRWTALHALQWTDNADMSELLLMRGADRFACRDAPQPPPTANSPPMHLYEDVDFVLPPDCTPFVDADVVAGAVDYINDNTQMEDVFRRGVDYWKRLLHRHHAPQMRQVVRTLLLLQRRFADSETGISAVPRMPVEMWLLVCTHLRSADFVQ